MTKQQDENDQRGPIELRHGRYYNFFYSSTAKSDEAVNTHSRGTQRQLEPVKERIPTDRVRPYCRTAAQRETAKLENEEQGTTSSNHPFFFHVYHREFASAFI